MATGSRIPRYTKTTRPILSVDYRRVLKEVKTKRAEIEEKKKDVEELKKSLALLKPSGPSSERGSESLSQLEPSTSARAHSGGIVGSSIRKVITTPGGTKRKGIDEYV